jgi:hypothetical protein
MGECGAARISPKVGVCSGGGDGAAVVFEEVAEFEAGARAATDRGRVSGAA